MAGIAADRGSRTGDQTTLIADDLVALWNDVQANMLTHADFERAEQSRLASYRKVWEEALLPDREGIETMLDAFYFELGTYLGAKTHAEVDEWGRAASDIQRTFWRDHVDPSNRHTVEQFYDRCDIELHNLLRWHTLTDDVSPLGYVTALTFAQQNGCRSHLDFGCGVGSGGILFARHGFATTLADISSPSLRFSRWRMELRGLQGQYLDLKKDGFPAEAFDFVTAMDVFEHLFDPVEAVDRIFAALKPGGFLFGRFDPGDGHHMTHIVKDFGPTFDRMRQLGMQEVWRDKWFWGHQVFRKA